MSALNLTNVKTGIFNDVFMIQNTGYSSVYDIFGSKTELSSLGGMNTTTLTQISATITGLSTLNSALATKANAADVYDTLFIDETVAVINSKIDLQDITLNNHTTSISNLTTNLATKANTTDVYNKDSIDDQFGTAYTHLKDYADSRATAVFAYADTIKTSVSNLTTTTNSVITNVGNINITLPSLITNSTLTSNLNNYTPLSFYNNTITTRLNSNLTSINNINATLPSLITSSTLTSSLSSYAPVTALANFTTNSLFVSGSATMQGSLSAYNPYQASNVLLCNNYYLLNSSTLVWTGYSGSYTI